MYYGCTIAIACTNSTYYGQSTIVYYVKALQDGITGTKRAVFGIKEPSFMTRILNYELSLI